MNWGKAIALFYSIFALSMVTMVFLSTKEDNSLVSDQYYLDDIQYQQQYNKIANSRQLNQPLNIHFDKSSQSLELSFPTELGSITGKLHLFCPSDRSQDQKINLITSQPGELITIPLELIKKGLWKIKIDWESNQVHYYDEKTIVF
jgi:hypothetical protein